MQKLNMNKLIKYRLFFMAFLAITLAFCTNKKKEVSVVVPQIQKVAFSKKLIFNDISFEIKNL
jgi:hypothetical protein